MQFQEQFLFKKFAESSDRPNSNSPGSYSETNHLSSVAKCRLSISMRDADRYLIQKFLAFATEDHSK
jgi:hypothetical protein